MNPAFFTPAFRLGTLCARISIAVLCLAAVLAIGARNVLAQQTVVHSETPGSGERVEGAENATSSNEIELNLKGADIAGPQPKGKGNRNFQTGSGRAGRLFLDDFNLMTGVFRGT